MLKSLDTPFQYLKGIGPKRAKVFKKAGINTIEDLLYYFPRRYEDRSRFLPISELKEGDAYTIKAEVLAKKSRQSWKRRNLGILELSVADNTGRLSVVWFNQPYLKDYFKVGEKVILYGRVQRQAFGLQMVAPEFEIITDDKDSSLDVGRIVPIYPVIEGVSQRYMRRIVHKALKEFVPLLKEPLPYDIRNRHGLLNLAKSILQIHFPETLTLQKEAYQRLSFEEFFFFLLPIVIRKLKTRQRPGLIHNPEGDLVKRFAESLPFELTFAQKRVINEIKQDMKRPFVMQRLLQGEVGSGKTIVALYASLIAIQSGYQVAFMVPTEVLARQHYETIKYQSLKVSDSKGKAIDIRLLVSSLARKEKEVIYREIKEGKIDLVVGTHALLEETLNFKNLGLVVIDEQHKFGVAQRALLPKKGNNPDVLIMTATPIPRTLAITLYGDLDISVIDELPKARKPVTTRLVKEDELDSVYAFIKEKVKEGRQAYIVYPLIEESYLLDLKSAEQMYQELKETTFKEFRLGLVHGQMKESVQDKVMSDFKCGKIDILISTTVLEVGIDVPSATVMVIEHAERFGLSQLHQLRGRVGRGAEESYCILVAQPKTEEAKRRLEIMVGTCDGFRIAEEDLKIRGPGEFFGSRQHGLSELKIANPLTQMQLLKKAREEVVRLINLDPNLEARQNALLKERLLERFPGYEELMVVG